MITYRNMYRHLRVQNLGSSLESPQSFELSQNLFIGIHLRFVHAYSDILHSVVVPFKFDFKPLDDDDDSGKNVNKMNKIDVTITATGHSVVCPAVDEKQKKINCNKLNASMQTLMHIYETG